MSREIKFRALYFNTDKSRCEWAYGLIGYMGDKGVQVARTTAYRPSARRMHGRCKQGW